MCHFVSAAIIGLLVVANPIAAADWEQFRGPNGSGVVSEVTHPLKWGDDKNVAWSVPLPGGGWSSPIVSGGRIFVTTAVSEEAGTPKGFGEGVASMGRFARSGAPEATATFEIHCLSLADGSLQWKSVVDTRKPPFKIHPSNSYATESPVTDGTRVYAYFASIGVVACLDFEGQEIWKRDLGAYPTSNDFGTGSSLAIDGDKIFIQCDNQDQSFVCALDAKTGADVWRRDRDSRTSWASPVIWQNKLRAEMVVCGAGNVTSYDPTTGDILWKLNGIGGAFSSSPTSDQERIYFGNSGRTSRGPLVAVEAGATGELDLDQVGQNGLAWVEDSSGPGMSSPVVVDGRLFLISRGIVTCHDAATGEQVYKTRLPDASRVAASLWAAGDKLFVLDESGRTSVIQVGDTFELIDANILEGLYWSTPSIAGESLLLRGAETLHCIRK